MSSTSDNSGQQSASDDLSGTGSSGEVPATDTYTVSLVLENATREQLVLITRLLDGTMYAVAEREALLRYVLTHNGDAGITELLNAGWDPSSTTWWVHTSGDQGAGGQVRG